MRWSKSSHADAIDLYAEKFAKGAVARIPDCPSPKWILPEYLREDIPGMHFLVFDDGTVVCHFSVCDPNNGGRAEKAQYWIGSPL